MNATFCATASCLPTGWPHWTRSAANSRATLVDHLPAPTQIAGSARRPVFSVDEGDLEALALLADQVLLRHEHVVEPRDRVLDAAQAHELVAVLDRHALGVVGQDERADAAARGRRDFGTLRHDDDHVGDRAVGRPQLAAVEHVARAVLGRGRRRWRAGRGRSRRRARSAGTRRCASSTSLGSHSRFCSSEPNRRSGSPRPIDWCAESSVASAECHVLASASAWL